MAHRGPDLIIEVKLMSSYVHVWGDLGRAYPGSEFVVANTLAKWKKL